MTRKRIYNFNHAQAAPTQSLEHLFQSAIAQHKQGNFQQAEQIYRQVIKVQPKHAYALNLLGVLISQYRQQHDEAEKLIAEAIKIDPDVADYYNNLGLALQQQNKFAAAAQAFKRATELNPELMMAWFGLGNVSIYIPDAKAAIEAYQNVNRINPDFLPAWNNLGNVYREIGQYEPAKEMFDKVLAQKPEFAEGWYNLGMLYKAMGKGEEALAAFNRAIEIKPDYLQAWNKRGNCRSQLLNDPEGAIADFDHVLSVNPHYLPSYLHKANVYRELGRFEDSDNELRKALDIDERAFSAFLGLVSGKSWNEQDLQKLQSVLEVADLDTKQLVQIHFSLGMIFNDRAEYEKAFHHLRQGNDLHRGTYTYSHNDSIEINSVLMRTFTRQCIDDLAQYGLDSELPVFIIGMPRSGTTLVEQIIGSHPAVHAAGELEWIGQHSFELANRGQVSGATPDWLPQLNAGEIGRMASGYLDFIKKLNNGALRITDKMPQNFLLVGLIAILFPNARIIHCRRHPLDTCLSIFEQKFAGGGHHYAYNLAELGLYYREYLRLMSHWESILPGRIFHIQYEALLADQEGMSRKLIEHIGLPWDDCCLQFHETERAVRTASQWQVRQKLYTTSRERWRNYEPWLGPLMEALGDAVTDSH